MKGEPDWWSDPVKVAEAKRIAAGPAGEILSKHALHYAQPLYFGERPSKDRISRINSATVTFLQLRGGTFAVTCSHVLEEYRRILANEHTALFQIGDELINPLPQLRSEDKGLDLALISLTEKQVRAIVRGEEIGSRTIQPSNWPPQPIREGDVLMFGGFPGQLRECKGFKDIEFGSFSAAGIRAAGARDTEIVCQLERDYWVQSLGVRGKNPNDLRELGGLSGAPVFVDRGLHWEFAGIIYEFSAEFDIMRIRPATLIAADGSIRNA